MIQKQYETLKARASRLKCAAKVGEIAGGFFLLAGGALTKDDNPKDFDIYGVDAPLDLVEIERRALADAAIGGYLSRTRNAITLRIEGQVVQFCNYHKSTPQETIEAFDFAHCMAGAVFYRTGELCRVFSTTDFWNSEADCTTWYTSSEYPLSSLMRCMKFHKRGLFKDNDYKPAALKIVRDIVARGFTDWDDFADQCASISESFADYNGVSTENLFYILEKGSEVAK